jgi:acyl-[acyl-carrier-protein] desaturase
MLAEAPSAVLPHIYEVFSTFKMPGTGIPRFTKRAVDMARVGVYNLRIHRDRVIEPLLRDWKIGSRSGLTSEAAEVQQKLMDLPARLARQAELFERRYGPVAG